MYLVIGQKPRRYRGGIKIIMIPVSNLSSKFLVSKETVVLLRRKSGIWKFSFIKRVKKIELPPLKIMKAGVSNVSPSSELIISY